MSDLVLDALGDLDPRGRVPLYAQLAERLRQAIVVGRLAPGARLPSEPECVRHFGISRLTVRQALSRLEADDLIRRERGKGTFVAPRLIEHDLRATSFEEDMLETQVEIEPRLLSWRRLEAAGEVCAALRLPLGEAVWRLERLRLVAGNPIGSELRFVADHVGRRLSLANLQSRPIFAIIQEATGKKFRRVEFAVGCMGAGEREAHILCVPRGSPLLIREHTYFAGGDEPLLHGVNVFRGDCYRFRFQTGVQPLRSQVFSAGAEEQVWRFWRTG